MTSAKARHVALLLIVVAALSGSLVGCDDDPDGPPACEDPICFSPNVRVNDVIEGDQINPRIASGPDGYVYVVWQGGGISLARSTNAGERFEASIRVVNDNAEGLRLEPDVAVDDAGTIYVVWRDFRTPSGRIRLATSRNLGLSFEPSVAVDRFTQSAQSHPTIAVQGQGVVYVAWTQNAGNGRDNIYFTQSSDGGRTFAVPIRVSDQPPATRFESDPDIAADAGGNIYVVWNDDRDPGWGLYMARSTDGGQSFLSNVRVDDAPTPFNGKEHPAVAIGSSGEVYVAWHDAREGVAAWKVYFSRSVDGGQTFAMNQVLSSPPTADGYGYTEAAYSLDIGSDMEDNVFVVWAQSSRERESDIISAVSVDGGATFHQPVRTNDDSGKHLQLAPCIRFGPHNEVYVAWTDTRGPDPWDIYFAVGRVQGAHAAFAFGGVTSYR